MNKLENTWRQLAQEGLVDRLALPEMAPLPAYAWHIRAMLGICGWVGGLLVLLFLGLSFSNVFDTPWLLLAGVALLALAILTYRRASSELGEQFALTMSLAGQGAFAVACFSLWEEQLSPSGWLLLVGMAQGLLAWWIPNGLHRMLSSLFAVLALHGAFYAQGWPNPVPVAVAWVGAACWLWEARAQYRLGERFMPLAIGFSLAWMVLPLIQIVLESTWGYGHPGFFSGGWYWSMNLLANLSLVGIAWRLMKQSGKPDWRLLALALLVAVVGAGAPGVVAGLSLVALGFARAYSRMWQGGLLATAFYISWFYYSLALTLLTKSAVLLLLGVILLGAAWWVARTWQEDQERG